MYCSEEELWNVHKFLSTLGLASHNIEYYLGVLKKIKKIPISICCISTVCSKTKKVPISINLKHDYLSCKSSSKGTHSSFLRCLDKAP